MKYSLFQLKPDENKTLNVRVQEMIVGAILSNHLKHGEAVPSTRSMAKMLKVSRNTVLASYQSLVDSGFLEAKERSGYRVCFELPKTGKPLHKKHVNSKNNSQESFHEATQYWSNGNAIKNPIGLKAISKYENWQNLPYAFICGQIDSRSLPVSQWCKCAYLSSNSKWTQIWTPDAPGKDDVQLLEEICRKILQRRGIYADTEQLLITLGAQHAMFMIANLLLNENSTIGFEDPGFPDAFNIFHRHTKRIVPLKVDSNGLIVDKDVLRNCDLVMTTPGHQSPTTVTLAKERRIELIKCAKDYNFVIVEDDYEIENNYFAPAIPALKSIDNQSRIIYVGSFSKSLFPGLRIGFIVADVHLIKELRALSRLMIRHAPMNNQRTMAFFMSLGYYDAFIKRINRDLRDKWLEAREAIKTELAMCSFSSSVGGSSFWLTGPEQLDSRLLANNLLQDGVFIETGDCYYNFAGDGAPRNHFRIGLSSINRSLIRPGIRLIGRRIEQMLN